MAFSGLLPFVLLKELQGRGVKYKWKFLRERGMVEESSSVSVLSIIIQEEKNKRGAIHICKWLVFLVEFLKIRNSVVWF